MIYVANIILLIREDVVLRSNLMSSLASARSPYDLGEVVFLKNPNANLKNMITYCNWIDQHIQYNNLNSEDKLRDNFDKTFFLITLYTIIREPRSSLSRSLCFCIVGAKTQT